MDSVSFLQFVAFHLVETGRCVDFILLMLWLYFDLMSISGHFHLIIGCLFCYFVSIWQISGLRFAIDSSFAKKKQKTNRQTKMIKNGGKNGQRFGKLRDHYALLAPAKLVLLHVIMPHRTIARDDKTTHSGSVCSVAKFTNDVQRIQIQFRQLFRC